MNTLFIPPITYDYSGLIAEDNAAPIAQQTGLLDADLKYLIPQLEAVRREMFWNLDLYGKGEPIPAEKQPFDAGFFALPDCFLNQDRQMLDQIIATADRLAKDVDRVIVLGIGGSYMGARALMEAGSEGPGVRKAAIVTLGASGVVVLERVGSGLSAVVPPAPEPVDPCADADQPAVKRLRFGDQPLGGKVFLGPSPRRQAQAPP